jgi:hypothetical protein
MQRAFLLQIGDVAQQSFFHKLADHYASPCLLVLGQSPRVLANSIPLCQNSCRLFLKSCV